MASSFTTIPIVVLSVSLNAAAQILLRKTMLSVSPIGQGGYWSFGLDILLCPWFIAGMSCYALSIGLWLIVLSRLEVSAAYPLLSIGYIITAFIGYFYLGEAVDGMRIAGIGLICVGILFISRSA